MRRHELTDREWALIAECLPARKAKGRKPPDFRRIYNGIFWILGTGAPWRDLPERYGPRSTVHGWFSRWSKDGTIDRYYDSIADAPGCRGAHRLGVVCH